MLPIVNAVPRSAAWCSIEYGSIAATLARPGRGPDPRAIYFFFSKLARLGCLDARVRRGVNRKATGARSIVGARSGLGRSLPVESFGPRLAGLDAARPAIVRRSSPRRGVPPGTGPPSVGTRPPRVTGGPSAATPRTRVRPERPCRGGGDRRAGNPETLSPHFKPLVSKPFVQGAGKAGAQEHLPI